MGTGAESIVCLSVEWGKMGKILEERLLPFVMSVSGKFVSKIEQSTVCFCDLRAVFNQKQLFFRWWSTARDIRTASSTPFAKILPAKWNNSGLRGNGWLADASACGVLPAAVWAGQRLILSKLSHLKLSAQAWEAWFISRSLWLTVELRRKKSKEAGKTDSMNGYEHSSNEYNLTVQAKIAIDMKSVWTQNDFETNSQF